MSTIYQIQSVAHSLNRLAAYEMKREDYKVHYVTLSDM